MPPGYGGAWLHAAQGPKGQRLRDPNRGVAAGVVLIKVVRLLTLNTSKQCVRNPNRGVAAGVVKFGVEQILTHPNNVYAIQTEALQQVR